jgi:DNA topoisomerase-1
VTLEDALRLLSLPRSLGQSRDGAPVSVGRGQYGPYVKYGTKYVSIKDDDPFTITLERALELVAEKQKADAARNILVFPEAGISVLDGRFGPYVTDGKKNAKVPKPPIPKTADEETRHALWRAAAAKLTLEECRELIAAAPEAKGRFGRRGGAGKAAKAEAPAAAPKKKAAAKPRAAGKAKPRTKAAAPAKVAAKSAARAKAAKA